MVRKIGEHYLGQTHIDEDERANLIPQHIKFQQELDEFEAKNIERAAKKYLLGNKPWDLGDSQVLQKIHKDMFDRTWKWAGSYRRSGKTIGVDHWMISDEIKKACDDFRYWIENKTYSDTEIAVRFHFRLVKIHPFPNGNGRFARFVADIFIATKRLSPLTWGSGDLKKGGTRNAYISALQKADNGNVSFLLKFAVS